MTDVIDPATLLGELGLPLDADCTFEFWAGALTFAVAGWKNSSWRVADVLNHPHAATAEGQQWVEDVLKLAGLDDRADKTLENIRCVGQKFPPETRKKHIPFTFYMEARALPLAEALKLVGAAETAREVREAVRVARNGSDGSSGLQTPAIATFAKVNMPTLRSRLMKTLYDLYEVVIDDDMGLEQIRLAARPLLKALRDL